MALTEVTGAAGRPWATELAGTVVELTVESELLAGNPLGDPTRRPLYVYLPPGVDRTGTGLPAVFVIQGFTGQVDMWKSRSAFEPTIFERIDAMFAEGDCPPGVIVYVDAWTSYGGSQFVNSTSTGRYMDYLCDEVVPFIDESFGTIASRDHRAIAGKSSGGYGAMVVPMKRPDVFGALASHAGDALFETCYLRDFPVAARALRDSWNGSFDRFFEELWAADRFEGRFHDPLDVYAMAACYSPDPDDPPKAMLPFEVETGRLIPEIWERWLEWDPVRMAPSHATALRSMKRIYLDAGRKDEYFLDLGAQAFSAELDALGVEHTLELFDGGHSGMSYRYPGAIRELLIAISES
jgi:S-formylglutathione hydrolase FrmB